MVHPDLIADPLELDTADLLQPVYPLTAGLTGNTIRKAMTAALDTLPAHEQDDPAVAELRGRLFFAGQLKGSADTTDLEAAIAADPGDLESLHQLALRKVVSEDYDAAIELLLQLIQKDRGYGDDAGRVALLKVFDLLGDDPRVNSYRRRMASLLY